MIRTELLCLFSLSQEELLNQKGFYLKQGQVNSKADGLLWLFYQFFGFVLTKILMFLSITVVGNLEKWGKYKEETNDLQLDNPRVSLEPREH